jgi:hypothetical protein
VGSNILGSKPKINDFFLLEVLMYQYYILFNNFRNVSLIYYILYDMKIGDISTLSVSWKANFKIGGKTHL